MIFRQLCRRCSHAWWPRTEDRPDRCPRCGSKFWDMESAPGRGKNRRSSRRMDRSPP